MKFGKICRRWQREYSPMKWEIVDECETKIWKRRVERFPVPGGWLYKITEQGNVSGSDQICYVPNPQK
jgi:hypothetical protein